jgi:hypothetical protein
MTERDQNTRQPVEFQQPPEEISHLYISIFRKFDSFETAKGRFDRTLIPAIQAGFDCLDWLDGTIQQNPAKDSPESAANLIIFQAEQKLVKVTTAFTLASATKDYRTMFKIAEALPQEHLYEIANELYNYGKSEKNSFISRIRLQITDKNDAESKYKAFKTRHEQALEHFLTNEDDYAENQLLHNQRELSKQKEHLDNLNREFNKKQMLAMTSVLSLAVAKALRTQDFETLQGIAVNLFPPEIKAKPAVKNHDSLAKFYRDIKKTVRDTDEAKETLILSYNQALTQIKEALENMEYYRNYQLENYNNLVLSFKPEELNAFLTDTISRTGNVNSVNALLSVTHLFQTNDYRRPETFTAQSETILGIVHRLDSEAASESETGAANPDIVTTKKISKMTESEFSSEVVFPAITEFYQKAADKGGLKVDEVIWPLNNVQYVNTCGVKHKQQQNIARQFSKDLKGAVEASQAEGKYSEAVGIAMFWINKSNITERKQVQRFMALVDIAIQKFHEAEESKKSAK